MAYVPGSIVLTHSKGLIGWAIRFGERLRDSKKAATWNHALLITDVNGGIIEAAGKGVRQANISKYSKTQRVVILPPKDLDADKAINFAKYSVGEPYGFLTILSIAIDLLTPRFIDFKSPRSFICSELVARCYEHGGYIWSKVDTSQIMPSDIEIEGMKWR